MTKATSDVFQGVGSEIIRAGDLVHDKENVFLVTDEDKLVVIYSYNGDEEVGTMYGLDSWDVALIPKGTHVRLEQ